MSLLQTSTAKFAALVAGVALVATLAFSVALPAHAALTESQIQSIISLLQSFGADQTTINNVDASLRGQPTSGGTGTGTSGGASCSQFTRDLTIGSTGSDVLALQQILNANGFAVNTAGAVGSAGFETDYFGSLTAAALGKWQAANGVSPAVGYFGPLTRAAFASSGACGTGTGTGTGTQTPAPAGSGLTVAAGTQPANSIAPQGVSRVPFTRFTVTAGTDGAVTVNSVTVQRVGLGNNASFSGVVLVDQDGNQLGTAKSFNSNDQATIGEPFTVPAGTTRTFLVAANMAASNAARAGEVPAISVVAVNTGATVSGSLPITGAFHTINATLSTGSLSLDVSNAFAANAPATKEIGTTAQRVSGFRLTAGSTEDVRLKMLRFNQTGSASTVNDITNIQIVVDGTAYPTTVSADGKFITANLGSGILISEGNNVEVYVQYDIVGGNANGRTIVFDVDETTDIFGEGATFGYGISPAAGTTAVSTLTDGTSNTTETSGTPYIFGNQVTISGASVTTIGKSNSVPAQNIAVNLADQPLGGFEVDIKGEAITVQSMVFTVASTTGSGTGLLTNVTIVDENGSVVAGPIDATYTSALSQTLTFTDSVTFPTGKHTYTIKGKVASGIGNGGTYIVSTTPSSGWTNVKGDVTGDTITLSQGAFSMNTMTVKTGALAIGRDATFSSKTIVAGGTTEELARFQLDAQQSGEDVRLSSFIATSTSTGANQNTLSSCQFYDGSTPLNTGSNVLNPSSAAGTTLSSTVTFDNPLTVAKGTVKTLSLKCNVSSSASGTYDFDHGTLSSFSVTGVGSSNSITPTGSSDSQALITIGTATLTVATDASSPGYGLVAAGSTDNTVGAYKFTTTNEGVTLQRVGLQLTNTASSTPSDLTVVRIYDGATQIGTATFVGSSNYATSTLSSPVLIPANSDKTLTVKADFASIGTSQAVEFSGHFVAIDVDTAGTNTQGVGESSGTTINATGSTSVSGQRVFKSYPTVSLDTLSSTGVQDGRLMRFKVTANSSGPVSLTNFALDIATTSGVSVQNVTIYGYTDANYSLPISGVASDGNLQNTNDCLSNSCTTGVDVAIGITNSSGTATAIQVPAGGTRYFEVRASVAGVESGDSITTTLLGDSSFPSTAAAASANPLLTAANAGTAETDFIWSPNSTTTVDRGSQDWTNGFGISGLPSSGLIQTRSQ